MKNKSDSVAQSPQDLLAELRALVTDAEKMVGDSLTENSEDAISALRARFDTAQERVSELYTTARKKVVAGAKYTDETIRANPYQSLAIAAGVGVLIGVLVGRRCSK